MGISHVIILKQSLLSSSFPLYMTSFTSGGNDPPYKNIMKNRTVPFHFKTTIHAYVHTYTHTYILYACAWIHTCMHGWIKHTYTEIYIHSCIHSCIYV